MHVIGCETCILTICKLNNNYLTLYNNATLFFQIIIKDYALALFVLCLVVIDVAILGIFTTVEGTRGELGVKKTSNKENMEDTIGVHHFCKICASKSAGLVSNVITVS